MMSAWHSSVASELALAKLYDLGEVVEALEAAGFDVSVARFRLRFVPVSARGGGRAQRQGLVDWLDYYARDRILFRFTRPPRR
jgi:hypothetical protein